MPTELRPRNRQAAARVPSAAGLGLVHLACLVACLVFLLAGRTSAARSTDAGAADASEYPAADQLPAIKELPDPFLLKDRSRVKGQADWDRRRGELKEMILYYEYGRMPPAPGEVKVTEERWTPSPPAPPRPASRPARATTRPAAQPAAQPPAAPAEAVELPPGATEKQYRLTTGPEGKVFTHLILTIPAGKGPFPAIVKGDLCWGRVSPAIVADVVKHGYMLAEFDRTEFAADKDDRTTGVYLAYPDYDCRDISAWAWGFHRVVDYLLTRDDVDRSHVVVTGHSRGGKAALLAGATDERVALTCPNASGAGGAGCYRYQAPQSEDLKRIVTTFPFWFSPRFTEFIGQVEKIPFDQHEVKALVAPRAYLSTESVGDLWANPEGTQVSHEAAKDVFRFLGAEDRMGIHYRQGKHEQNEEDFAALLEFADHVFFGKPLTQSFDRLPFPDAPRMHTWTAATPARAGD